MSGFEVAAEELQSHLGPVGTVKEDLKRCKAAADQVGYSSIEGYGVFVMNLLRFPVAACLGDTTKLVDSAADLAAAFYNGVKANNECYLATEDAIKEMWDGAKNDGWAE